MRADSVLWWVLLLLLLLQGELENVCLRYTLNKHDALNEALKWRCIYSIMTLFIHMVLSVSSSLCHALSYASRQSLCCCWLHNPWWMLIVILPPSQCGLDRLSHRRLLLAARGKDVRWNGSHPDERSALFLLPLLVTSSQPGYLSASPLRPSP